MTVTATDDDETTPLSGSLTVTVTVTDAEEEGTITIEPLRGWDGTPFRAVLDRRRRRNHRRDVAVGAVSQRQERLDGHLRRHFVHLLGDYQ